MNILLHVKKFKVLNEMNNILQKYRKSKVHKNNVDS